MAAALEKRLGLAGCSSGSQAGEGRRFRVKHSGANAHERSRSEDGSVAGGQRESQQSGQGDTHAHREGIGLRPAVGMETDERLEDGGRQLLGEGDQAYLAEIEMEGILEERIDRGNQRLQRVVQEVEEADGEKNLEDGLLTSVCRSGCPNSGQVCVASHLEPESLNHW